MENSSSPTVAQMVLENHVLLPRFLSVPVNHEATGYPPVARIETARAVSSVQPFQVVLSGLSRQARPTAVAMACGSPAAAGKTALTPSFVDRQGRRTPSAVTRKRSQPAER